MVPLPRGSVLAVLGGFGSGKSTLLAALPGLNPATGWLGPGAGAEPEEYWSEVHATPSPAPWTESGRAGG